MENTVYTVDYFINKFQNIPEQDWLTHQYANHQETRFCALGHCGERTDCVTLNPLPSEESFALMTMFIQYLSTDPSIINDGEGVHPYEQETPKQRILAALYDIKAKQHPEVKERIVYVTVDKEVRELQKTELIEN